MKRAARLPVLTLLAAVITAVMGACGVPAEDVARPIPHTPGSTAAPTPAATQSGPSTQKLYLVKDGLLVPVERHQPTDTGVTELLQLLLAGPTESEKDSGITSALLGTNAVTKVEVSSGEAMVELAPAPEGTGRTDDVLAFAQIVCTLADLPNVDRVSFIRDGQRLDVPRGDGPLTQEPLTPADYSNLIAPR